MTVRDSAINSRMGTQRFVIGFMAFIGVLGVVLEYIVEGGEGDLFVWLIAFGLGIVFWWLAGRFLEDPSGSLLNSLKPPFYAYIFCWILAFATTFVIRGEIVVITALGILLNLVATYFMHEFMVVGMSLLSASESPGGSEWNNPGAKP